MITLRKVNRDGWQLFAPKGHALSAIFRGDRFEAEEWARAWISSFHNWSLKIEGSKDEKENRISR
jgi:hypothetical protein